MFWRIFLYPPELLIPHVYVREHLRNPPLLRVRKSKKSKNLDFFREMGDLVDFWGVFGISAPLFGFSKVGDFFGSFSSQNETQLQKCVLKDFFVPTRAVDSARLCPRTLAEPPAPKGSKIENFLKITQIPADSLTSLHSNILAPREGNLSGILPAPLIFRCGGVARAANSCAHSKPSRRHRILVPSPYGPRRATLPKSTARSGPILSNLVQKILAKKDRTVAWDLGLDRVLYQRNCAALLTVILSPPRANRCLTLLYQFDRTCCVPKQMMVRPVF